MNVALQPLEFVVREAVEEAKKSPCIKSKRGACVFLPVPNPADGQDVVSYYATAHNGPPGRVSQCLGNDACKRACGQRCVHAEARVVRLAIEADAQRTWGNSSLGRMEVLHVKVVGGELVAGGGPSCVTCSREILDAGLGFVWLFEHGLKTRPIGSFRCRTCDQRGDIGRVREHEGRYRCPSCGNAEVDLELRGYSKPPITKVGTWRRYTSEQFHVETCKNLEIA